jgi:curli production assembly/transport component CsgG
MILFFCRLLCGILAALSITSCSSVFQPISSGKATTDYRSGISDLLRSLPPPPEPIVVAVYKFRDQTGQYKSSDTQVQYSTAVTQGATSMLVRALMEAGNGKWFTVLEREGLTDLMNERKIISQTREMYANKNEPHTPNLPPFLYAPIVLEGGIIAYETNLLTGGVGAKYFGAGGSTEFRRDTVTSMLRAVSVKNGSILNQVDARKTIFSMALDSGLYRFVSFMRLLEAEAGVTSNEPPQMAVMETIEACVYAMIMEGLIDKLWEVKDQSRVRSLIEAYLKQRDFEMVADFDDKGNVTSLKPADTEAN